MQFLDDLTDGRCKGTNSRGEAQRRRPDDAERQVRADAIKMFKTEKN